MTSSSVIAYNKGSQPCGIPQWLSTKVSTSGPEGSRLETRFHPRSIIRYIIPLVRRERLERWASPSSSEQGSKLRGPSQNSSRVAAKCNVNIS
ncbi:hypothetical protein AVEN_265132-1 [Araneus ventricosus]|uniref:Uncharacterized protein n=1 Tax=Araneus ventricosus TaxID=182803 RepID=A0A4Y2U0F3_ARAVE|nr:hypothetical protein AVEN_265132-1 [Araneus ventricosus]